MEKKLVYLALILFVISAVIFYTLSDRNPTGLASRDNSEKPLFQITLMIPKEYKAVSDGSQILSYLEVKRMGSGGRMDVILEYEIISPGGGILESKSETVAVETENSFVRYIDLPDQAGIGFYTLSAKLKYSADKEAYSEATFLVY